MPLSEQIPDLLSNQTSKRTKKELRTYKKEKKRERNKKENEKEKKHTSADLWRIRTHSEAAYANGRFVNPVRVWCVRFVRFFAN